MEEQKDGHWVLQESGPLKFPSIEILQQGPDADLKVQTIEK